MDYYISRQPQQGIRRETSQLPRDCTCHSPTTHLLEFSWDIVNELVSAHGQKLQLENVHVGFYLGYDATAHAIEGFSSRRSKHW
jgi:hypothetical protein